MVTLQSRFGQMLVFNLVHQAWCGGRIRCACTEMTVLVTDENPRTGERALRRVVKKVPASLTLLARERRAGLPDAVLCVPDVRAAIERGLVRIVEQTADSKPDLEPLPRQRDRKDE